MSTDTDSPSIRDRLNETRHRLEQLKSRRGALGLAASRGDQDARRELANIVSQVQAAEIEISILEDADKVEREQSGAASTKWQADARIAAGAHAVAIAREIEASVREARRAHAAYEGFVAKAHEQAIELRRKLREAVENFSGEVVCFGQIEAVCRNQVTDQELEVFYRSIHKQAEARHQDAILRAQRAAA